MNKEEIVVISPDTETISCDGGDDSLGHPTVYYSFKEKNKVVCSYCGKIYKKNIEDK